MSSQIWVGMLRTCHGVSHNPSTTQDNTRIQRHHATSILPGIVPHPSAITAVSLPKSFQSCRPFLILLHSHGFVPLSSTLLASVLGLEVGLLPPWQICAHVLNISEVFLQVMQHVFRWDASRGNPFASNSEWLCNAHSHLKQCLIEKRSDTAQDHAHRQILKTVRQVFCMHFALESAQMSTCEDHAEGNTRRQADADGVDDVVNLRKGTTWHNGVGPGGPG